MMTRLTAAMDLPPAGATDSEPGPLSPRQQTILRAIVDMYVTTAAPVGSDRIVRTYCPLVSPATVRNDMAHLARQGYICTPHTSAGRIPTDRGYRYYVRHLMRPVDLLPDERRMIDHQFHQIERDLGQWLQLAATMLAQLTENAAVVTAPVAQNIRLRHLDLIATQDHAALLVALFQEGTLHQHLLRCPEPLYQEQLDRTARRMTDELSGQPASDVAAWSNGQAPLDFDVRDTLVHLMRRVARQAVTDVWYDGVRFLLAQPEFERAEKSRAVLQAFEERRALAEIANTVTASNGVQVLIGEENAAAALHDCAVVATRYGSGRASGVIAVIGPVRMRYDRVVATIQYLGGVMSGLWRELGE